MYHVVRLAYPGADPTAEDEVLFKGSREECHAYMRRRFRACKLPNCGCCDILDLRHNGRAVTWVVDF